MRHPRSRSQRRHQRERVMANRRFRWLVVWREERWSWNRQWTPDWGRYAKWNMNCGCMMCHAGKYFKEKRKRREALKRDAKEQEWQECPYSS